MADRAVKKAKPKPVAATSLRGRVPALSRSAADALRGFFARQRHWLLRDGGVLRLDVAGSGDGTPGGDTFALDADGTRLALRFAPGTDDAGSDGLRWNDHVGRSRVLAWSLAHEGRLMRLSEALGISLLPVADGGNEDAPGGDDGVWLDFSIDDYADDEAQTPSMRTRGALRVPAAWLSWLAERADATSTDETPLPGYWRRLPTTVSIAFAIPALGARDWRSLRPGDAIVVGRSVRPPPLQARAAGRAWPLVATPDGWRVEGPAQPLPPNPPSLPERKMSENDDNTVTAAAVEDPARNLPVRVEFEIGQVELSLGELADLQPGYVFALPAQLEGANVVIRANGRSSGRGEVVAVGDTLGVRLLSWT
jgi:type III secretion system YscQ/HrcQ family protein